MSLYIAHSLFAFKRRKRDDDITYTKNIKIMTLRNT